LRKSAIVRFGGDGVSFSFVFFLFFVLFVVREVREDFRRGVSLSFSVINVGVNVSSLNVCDEVSCGVAVAFSVSEDENNDCCVFEKEEGVCV
jgi:hypothetical protein